jgi:hypothetical protein
MTFTIINPGDDVVAVTAMGNWRHINYGNTLLPVNSSGSGVTNTLDLGSSSYLFKNGYFRGYIVEEGKIKCKSSGANVSTTSSIDISFNNTDAYDVGGCHDPTSNPERFSAPEDGMYLVSFSALLEQTGGTTGLVRLRHYNSSDVLQETVEMYWMSDTTKSGYRTLTTAIQLAATDYIVITILVGAGGTFSANAPALIFAYL